MILLGVALAGALGAPARFLVERGISRAGRFQFPWGTFVVNIGGSLALGILAGAVLAQGFSKDAQTVLGTGFLGAYTTFSTFVYEVVRVAEDGRRTIALAYALGSLLVGVAAAAAGLAIMGAW